MDEPDRFARVLLSFLESTQPAPIDRVLLRDRMTSHGRTLRERHTPAWNEAASVQADGDPPVGLLGEPPAAEMRSRQPPERSAE